MVAARVPPHDLDAEAAVLSAIMLDKSAIEKVAPILRPEQFYSEANRRIYEVCVELSSQGTPIDVVSVAGMLRDRERLAQVGGSAYLAQLCDAVPSVAHIETYARMVREKWRVRQLISTCQRVAAEGYGDTGDIQEFIENAANEVSELARRRSKSGFVQAGPAVQGEYKRLAEAASRGDRLMGMSTGFYRVDAKTGGLHDGELTIVAARPGLGKTAFVLNLAANVVTHEVLPMQAVAFFSLEMPIEQLSMRLMCSEARVDLGKARQGFLNPRDWTELTTAAAAILTWPLYINDTPALTLLELQSELRDQEAECEKKGEKLSLVVVDYLQLMTGNQGGNREQEISSISRGLKLIAKKFKVPVIALSQLNRAPELRGAKDRRPQLADLRESGAIEQDADNIFFLYREDYYDKETDNRGIAEINIAKQRNGPTGKTLCRFEEACTRFDNLAKGEHEFDDDAA